LGKYYPEDTHPLNLPPDERERRFSAMSTSSDSPGAYPTDDDTEMETPYLNNTNETNGHTNRDSSPAPPPHKAPSPPPKPALDPEACKATGNKYFKAKDYTRAVVEYTKGENTFAAALQHRFLLPRYTDTANTGACLQLSVLNPNQ